ncbi:uncharacterized protein LOC127011788 [Drosophila biarmipes]|uniref:uncharacterized protein LOC127011788 n=1 Tax=Drosophila biarmipes TaxID=125945 RepID=UPI0021CCDADF|nr:uncharacterized protein LOC127011788 [Drosophila biarmipes]
MSTLIRQCVRLFGIHIFHSDPSNSSSDFLVLSIFSSTTFLLRRRHRIRTIFEVPSSFHQLNGEAWRGTLVTPRPSLSKKGSRILLYLVFIFLIGVVQHLTGMDFFSFLDTSRHWLPHNGWC